MSHYLIKKLLRWRKYEDYSANPKTILQVDELKLNEALLLFELKSENCFEEVKSFVIFIAGSE